MWYPEMPLAPVIRAVRPVYAGVEGKVGRPWKMPRETTVCEFEFSVMVVLLGSDTAVVGWVVGEAVDF